MQGIYFEREFRHWGRRQRIEKRATLMIQVTDSNWRECDVENIAGEWQQRKRGDTVQFKIVNIRGLEHIPFKWVDNNDLRWWDAECDGGKFVYRGFFAPEEA